MKIFLLLMPLLLGCSSNNRTGEMGRTPVINLSDKVAEVSSLPLSEATAKVDVIPLQSTEKSILGRILKVQVTNDYIWVNHIIDSHGHLYRFSRSGKYLNKIGKLGQGPEEFTRMSDFIIDEEHQEVYIITTVSGIKVCDFEGNYKRDATKQKLFMDEAFSAKSSQFILYRQSFFLSQNLCVIKPIDNPKDSLWSIALMNSAFNKDKIFKNPVHIGKEKQIVAHRATPESGAVNYLTENSSSFDLYNDEFTLKYPDTDTIYQYDMERKDFIPQYAIFTEEKKGDYELTHWWIKDRKSFDYFTITGYYPTKDYIYLIGSKGDEIYTFCYNKEDKTVRKQVREGSITERKLPWFSQPFLHIDRPFVLKNDLLGGNFTVDYRSCGRYWVDVLEPGSDDNWIDVEQIKASTSCDEDKKQYFIRTLEVVDEDSNPILVIATLK